MSIRVALALIPLTWSAMSVGQAGATASTDVHEGAPRFVIDQQYHDALMAIRTAALKQQAVDGGLLTQPHVVKIQARIDDAQRAYRNALWRDYPESVNADGSIRR